MAWDSLMDFQGSQSQKEGQCSLEIHQAIPKLSSYPYLEACYNYNQGAASAATITKAL